MESNVRILILGASYGSLLAIKLLLAGHTVKLICLPAEADLINSEGARVRLPVKGRDGLGGARLAGAAGQTHCRRPGDGGSLRLRSRRPGDAGAPVPLGRRARVAGRRGQGESALHVDHEHAAAALSRAHPGPCGRRLPGLLHGRERMGRLRSEAHDAVQSGRAGVSPARGKGERAPGQAAHQLQGCGVRAARACGDAAAPRVRYRGRPIRRGPDRAARQAARARLDLRAAREMGDAARGKLPLRATGWRAQHQGRGARRHRRVAVRVRLGGQGVPVPRRGRRRSCTVRKVRRTRRSRCRTRRRPRGRSPPARPTSSARTASCRRLRRNGGCAAMPSIRPLRSSTNGSSATGRRRRNPRTPHRATIVP